jgi:NAD+ synthase (glutamine-hydrolysing)
MSLKIYCSQETFKNSGLPANTKKIIEKINLAKKIGADIVLFPELFLTGYFCMDDFLSDDFILSQQFYLNKICLETENICVIFGMVDFDEKAKNKDGTFAKYNSAVVIRNQKVVKQIAKSNLPDDNIFFESRYFQTKKQTAKNRIFEIKNCKIGIQICEDLWDQNYLQKPTLELTEAKADLILNLSSSPFWQFKDLERKTVLFDKINQFGTPIIYLNGVGSYDGYDGQLVLDGGSLVADSSGIFEIEKFVKKDFLVEFDAKEGIKSVKSFNLNIENKNLDEKVDWEKVFELKDLENLAETKQNKNSENSILNTDFELENTLKALILGVKTYFEKNSLKKIIIGLSGGIDSSLVAALACLANDSNNKVLGVFMPSKISSKDSQKDAFELATNLQIEYQEIAIAGVLSNIIKSPIKINQNQQNLEFKNSITTQNLQARIRGLFLMMLANEQNGLVLSTGNKTEIALGYTTLYGDSVGGLSPIGDLDKLQVYKLSRFINQNYQKLGFKNLPIPKNVLVKEPSAELEIGQTDQNSLGENYQKLTPLVNEIIENSKLDLTDFKLANKLAQKFDLSVDFVKKILNLIQKSEFKRRQLPPAIKITKKSFGIGRKVQD